MYFRNSPALLGIRCRTKYALSFAAMTLALFFGATSFAATISASASAIPHPGTPIRPDVFYNGLPDTPLRTYVPDGVVNAIQRVGDTVYIGGQFTRIGPRTGPGVEVALDGSVTAGLPEISGSGPSSSGGSVTGLRSVISDGAGGWYIGGLFTHVGGVPRTNAAHILADHTVDPNFFPVLNGSVTSLALNGVILYMAGQFTLVDGSPYSNIAGYHTLYGFATSFNPYANGAVKSIAVSSDGLTVYVGGSFTTIGGQARSGLAALKASNGQVIPTFSTVLSSSGTSSVSSLAIAGSTLYIGGSFDNVNGLPRLSLAAVTLGGATDGNVVVGFDPQPTPSYASMDSVSVSGSVVYAAGTFDTIGGQARHNLAGLNMADASATNFDPSPQANLNALAVSGSTVYVAGGFTSIGGQSRNYIAALDATSGAATAFNPNPDSSVMAMAVTGTAVYFGGLFNAIGGVSRSGLAALHASDGTPTTWDPNPQGPNGNYALIQALQVSGSVMYVGGTFVTVGGQPRQNIAALDLATGVANSWNPAAQGGVQALAVSANLVYVAGYFNNIGGQPRLALAALNVGDGTATSWTPSLDGGVNVLLISGNSLYVGGTYSHMNGITRHSLAAFDATTGALSGWDPQLSPIPSEATPFINVLAASGTTLYAGGGFGAVQGVIRNNIAGINTSTGTPTPFDAAIPGDGTENNVVNSIAVDDADALVYAGGKFTRIGGQSRNLLAALNVADGSATNFNPDFAGGGTVYALLFNTGSLYVGGSFATTALAPTADFAAFGKDVIFHNGFEIP